MPRNLLPSILASLGSIMILLATSIPLFEWKISNVISDFPPTHEIHTSSLTTKLGSSLSEGLFYGKVYVTQQGAICPYNAMDITMRRLQSDDALEKISLIAKETYIPLLDNLSVVVIYLAGIYIWLYAILCRRPFWETIGLTISAILIFISLTQLVRPFLGKVGSTFGFYGTSNCYHGTITFTISLAKIHYEVPILLLIGVLLELGVFVIILSQITRIAKERKTVSS